MKYKRSRKQTLTIRLTPDEKDLLFRKAKMLGASVTNFILLCTLQRQTEISAVAKQLLERLAGIEYVLEEMKKDMRSHEYYDVLKIQEELRMDLCRLIRSA